MVGKKRRDIYAELRHFAREEWRKDPAKASPDILLASDQIRGALGVPCVIHVCWDDGGHADQSYHYTGQAVDAHFVDQGQSHLQELLAILSVPTVGGVGFYPDWFPRPGWHWDVRSTVPRLFWARRGGKYHYGIQAIAEAIRSM
jgi:hypothetical protein